MVLVAEERLTVVAYFDEAPSTVHIEYHYWGGQTWSVYIDRYFYGRVWATQHGWQNDICWGYVLSWDDLQAIIEMLQQYHSKYIKHACCL